MIPLFDLYVVPAVDGEWRKYTSTLPVQSGQSVIFIYTLAVGTFLGVRDLVIGISRIRYYGCPQTGD